jgi:hypothetical protein
MGNPASSRSSFHPNPDPATEASHRDTAWTWNTVFAVEDVNESCEFGAEIGILRRHKALIPPKNVLYM